MSTLLAIGELAEASGVSVSALRYYDDVGLVTPAARVGGKRRFDPAAVGRVSFIRHAQEAGFSLDEIRTMLDDTAGEWRGQVEAKILELTYRRARLDTMIGMLHEMQKCGCEAVSACPRFDA